MVAGLLRRVSCHVSERPTEHSEHVAKLPGTSGAQDSDVEGCGHCDDDGVDVASRCLAFDMSGGANGAKRPLEPPLDGRVRRRAAAHDSLLALQLLQTLKILGPCQRRLAPDALAWNQRGPLLQTADPQPQAFRLFNRGVRVQMRAAVGAEHLRPLVATVGDLDVGLWRAADQAEAVGARGHRNPIGSSREVLTGGAVTDRHARGIHDGLERDGSAMASAVNLHRVTHVLGLSCLTLAMSGGPKAAKQALERPLDGAVRPHVNCAYTEPEEHHLPTPGYLGPQRESFRGEVHHSRVRG